MMDPTGSLRSHWPASPSLPLAVSLAHSAAVLEELSEMACMFMFASGIALLTYELG
jgi:hypothetical protein